MYRRSLSWGGPERAAGSNLRVRHTPVTKQTTAGCTGGRFGGVAEGDRTPDLQYHKLAL